MTEIGPQAVKAVAWNAAGTFGTQAVSFVITVVLARLLSPAEFGLVAMLTVFVALAGVLVDSGYVAALIQKPTVTPEDESSVFALNLVVALVLCVVFWFAAVPIAAFYHQPALVPITRVTSLVLVGNALGMVQTALLSKRLDFRALGQATIGAALASGLLAIVLAARGWGVWSLVAQSVASSFVRSGLLWVLAPWRPRWLFSFGAVRSLFRYSSRLLVTSLLAAIIENIMSIVIGRLFDPAALGLFERAQAAQRAVTRALNSVVGDVSFPTYSALQADRAALRRTFRRSVVASSAVIMPLMTVLAAVGRPLFGVVYSERWLASVPYFQVLCVAGSVYHLHALNLSLIKSSGRSDLFLRLALCRQALVVLSVLGSCRYGVMAMVWTQFVVVVTLVFANGAYAGRLADYGILTQLREVAPLAAAAVLAAGAAQAVGLAVHDWRPGYQLVPMAAAGALTYVGLVYATNIAGAAELAQQLRAKLGRRRPALGRRRRPGAEEADGATEE